MALNESWRKTLVYELDQLTKVYGGLTLPAPRLIDCELVFTLLADYLPEEDPRLAWAILNGHSFPALERIPHEGRRAVVLVRRWLPGPLGRGTWEENLAKYRELSPPYPLYALTGRSLVLQSTPVLPERLALMREAL